MDFTDGKMSYLLNSYCPKCGKVDVNLFHYLWACPKIRNFWSEGGHTLGDPSSNEQISQMGNIMLIRPWALGPKDRITMSRIGQSD